MRVRGHGCCARVAEFCQRIGQMKDDKVAGMHTQSWRFVARCIGVAVANGAVRLRGITRGQLRFQNPILAAQVLRFLDHAPGFRARTYTFGVCTKRCEA